MPASTSSLLLKFRRRDTQFGVTRETVKAMAVRFDVSETEIVHIALSRLARDFPNLPCRTPGPKPRPALVCDVTEREDGVAVSMLFRTRLAGSGW